MKKKICGLFVTLILTLSFCILSVSADNESDKTIKRIISVAYDDSGSMSTNDNWAYASYSLQNMIGLMNSNDEFNVVKMSDLKNVGINLSNNSDRTSDIKMVEGWNTVAGTDVSAIEIAGNWLKTKKDEYKDSQTVEYWLVVLTDGSFGNNISAYTYMENYFNNLKSSMDGSKFEGVFVAIGSGITKETKDTWNKTMKDHLISANNSTDIINAMNEVSGLILGQGGKYVDINIKTISKGNGVEFETPFPLKKFIIFEQNQSVSINEIKVDEMKVNSVADFKTNKPGSGSFNSRIIHCEGENEEYIPAGKIMVNFDSKIDVGESKFKILTEAAVNATLKVVDKKGNIVDDINSISFTEGETIELAAVITNGIDNSRINLREWAKQMEGSLVINGEEIEMKYNSKENLFYATYEVKSGNNLAYTVVSLPGYFRTKSDILNIYPREVIDTPDVSVSSSTVLVPYRYTDKYEEIGKFSYIVTGTHMDGLCDFEFKNMPNGITVSVNDVYADKFGKLSVKIYNNVPATVKFYRNKNYKETEKSRITIDVKSSEYELQWKENSITEIVLEPVKRKITIEKSIASGIDKLNVSNFNRKDIYIVSVLGDNEYLTKEELEKISIEMNKVTGVSLESEVTYYNGKDVLIIKCKKTLPSIFVKTGNIDIDMVLKTMYGEESDKIDISFNLKDSVMKYILPILAVFLVVLVVGYIPGVKKRLYDKKYHIQVNGEDEAIHVKFISRILPYVTENGTGSDLILKASSNKNKVIVINNFNNSEKIYLDDELIENGTSKFDLPLNSKLKVVDGVERIYIYLDSRNDNVIDHNLSDFDNIDSVFGYGEATSFTGSDEIDGDFFG